MLMLYDLLSEIVKIDDILLIVKSQGVVSEIRSNSMKIKQKDKWITIGENDGPAHMHIDSDIIDTAKFVEEVKPERISFSVQFFNKHEEKVLAAFFTKMYDDSKELIHERKKLYDNLRQKYSSKIKF